MELPPSPDTIQYPHITQLGSGMYRNEIFHAAVTVCVELSLQASERRSSTAGMDGVNSSVLMSMIQSQQLVMVEAVKRTLEDFGKRIGLGLKGCKPYFYLSIVLASVQSRLKGEDPLCNVDAASKRAIRIGTDMLNGSSYHDAKSNFENPSVQVSYHCYMSFALANIDSDATFFGDGLCIYYTQ